MAFLTSEPFHRNGNGSSDKEALDNSGGRWYFSRKEIEEGSPSRIDGIDLKKEAYLRKSYCTFLQDLGMRLKVPQVTIATAIVFCHRFFLRQSHAKNDRRTVATVCMFLAGKVEETPRALKDVILISYEIIHKKDTSAIQKIKQKDTYEQQKELILLGERIVLTTLGFDLNVHHPYKPLVEAIKRFKVAQNALAQVAWNFVNDGLRTSLCLQYKPHLIAAGAIFLAAKFLKVKLPSDGEKVWWQEFDVTPRQLEDVSNQMLELYEQNRTGQSSLTNEVEGSIGGNNQPAALASTVGENSMSGNGPSSHAGISSVKQEPIPAFACPSGSLRRDVLQTTQMNSDGNASSDNKKVIWDSTVDEVKYDSTDEAGQNFGHYCNTEETSKGVMSNKPSNPMKIECQDHDQVISTGTGNRFSGSDDNVKEYSPTDVITKIDKGKVKAALEKRRRLRNNVSKKKDIVDDDDLIERELENGIEFALEEENTKERKYKDSSSPLIKQEFEDDCFKNEGNEDAKEIQLAYQQPLVDSTKYRSFDVERTRGHETSFDNAEEGELSSLDEQEFPSPKDHNMSANSKQLTGVSSNWKSEGLKRNRDDYDCVNPVNERVMISFRHPDGRQQYDDSQREAPGTVGLGYPERDNKKQRYATHG